MTLVLSTPSAGFNPRPSRSRGATGGGVTSAPTPLSFNPRPSRSRGATPPARQRGGPPRVSTHAPRVHEERPRPGPPDGPPRGFNPRPSRSRGATSGTPPGYWLRKFQPTPLAFTRSDRAQVNKVALLRPVSTHAPRVHEERRASIRVSTDAHCFNPRPSRSRGATRQEWVLEAELGFQPTPLAFTRSDEIVGAGHVGAGSVSTHAPRVHEERRSGAAARQVVGHVSTHAPRVHEERPQRH